MKAHSRLDRVKLFFKGVLMGAADAVPGVSGGTIAFITGIYEELIHSIRNCDLTALKILKSEGVKPFWRHINGSFLITLISGIAISILSLAPVVLFLLEHYPIPLWSFFFGLIVASSWIVLRHIDQWNANRMSGLAIGTLLAYLITSLSPASIEPSYLMVFLSGMIAICAMILPGISGSFILLLLGMYTFVLSAIKNFEFLTLTIFLMGCVTGILSFSRLLSWAFNHYREMTLAVLGGFLIGSLNKVWPWKYTLAYRLNSSGESVPLIEQNVMPAAYQELTGADSLWMIGIALAILGLVMVILIERRAN